MSISELGNNRHFVRNNDNGRRFRDMFDNLIDLFDEISVDIRERLIEHNYRRVAYDCPPQQGALELSARKSADDTLAQISNAHQLKSIIDLTLCFCRITAVKVSSVGKQP